MSNKRVTRRNKPQPQKKRSTRIVTIALYGPDDTLATKIVASVVKKSSGKVEEMNRWYSDGSVDVRELDNAVKGIAEVVGRINPAEVVSPSTIFGCPHEEGVDYPVGESCPQCPFWAGRDRFLG